MPTNFAYFIAKAKYPVNSRGNFNFKDDGGISW